MIPLAVTQSSDGIAINTLCTSGFVDDVMISHNGVDGPEAKTTCMFCRVRQMATPGGKVDVYDRGLFAMCSHRRSGE